MIVLQGKGISNGVAQGPLCFLQRRIASATKISVSDIEAEKLRLADAQAESIAQLEALAKECRKKVGDEAASLFETHAMFIEDEDYVEYILDTLTRERCNAEYAVKVAGERFATLFSALDDACIRAKAADIQDVTCRILSNLMGAEEVGIDSDIPVILAADDLTPTEMIRLDKNKILGIVCQGGSAVSHTAVLTRIMEIPAVYDLGDPLNADHNGSVACIDGETGQVVLEPDDNTLITFQTKYQKQQEMKELLLSMGGKEDVTLDGQELMLCCNINSPDDVAAVLANDGQGIGLFRSEYLFLMASDYPSEEDQFQAYKTVAAAMKGNRVVIRTLDIGADKQASYFHLSKEENPAMGVRSIRVCLSRPEMFRTQLRALYRASAFGKVAIMFPMITSVWEVRECKQICHSVLTELDQEGIPYNKETEIGIMIDTPASVLIADALAKEVDFFSVGTNDLTQYILACDRQANTLDKFFDPHHPAVLRAIKMAADAAHAAGIRICICGDLAADVKLLNTFLAVGVDELSLPPSAVLPLRAELHKAAAKNCTLEKLEC